MAWYLGSHWFKYFPRSFGYICIFVACELNKFLETKACAMLIFCTTFQAIGYVLSITCFASEQAVGSLCENNNEIRIYIHDLFMVFGLLASINVWRGFWVLLDLNFGDSITALSVMNGVAWKLLMVVNCLNSLSGRGVVKDAEESGMKCIKLPIQYFQKVMVNNQTTSNTHEAKFIDICVATKLWNWPNWLSWIMIKLMVYKKPSSDEWGNLSTSRETIQSLSPV